MGRSHALAYHRIDDFEIVGIVTRSPESRGKLNEELGGGYAEFGNYEEALAATKPDVVSISTYPDTHAPYALAAFDAGADVFIEKPLAETVEEAEKIVAKARELNRKLVIGYILRHHPSWIKFIEVAQTLGKRFKNGSDAGRTVHSDLLADTEMQAHMQKRIGLTALGQIVLI